MNYSMQLVAKIISFAMLLMQHWGKRPEQPVSRILFPIRVTPKPGNDHSSMEAGCPTSLATYPGTRAGHPQKLLYLVLHQVGFAKLPRSPEELVRSYRTVSPLPVARPYVWYRAVYFLLHFPSRLRDFML